MQNVQKITKQMNVQTQLKNAVTGKDHAAFDKNCKIFLENFAKANFL